MLDFLFKKRSRATNAMPAAVLVDEQSALSSKELRKQDELNLADSFAGQESAALNFILNSNFADARLQAFKHVHSADALRQISQALRNVDRRVSRLAHEKLAELDYQQKMVVAARACLLQGQTLLQSANLMANQVTLWDKERTALGDHGLSLSGIRSDLENRLQAQVNLQREAMQLTSELRSVAESLWPADALQEKMTEWETQLQQIRAHHLVASLPHGQLVLLETELDRAKVYARQMADVNFILSKRTAALNGWKESEQVDVKSMRNTWSNLSVSALLMGEQQLLCAAQQDEQFTAMLSRETAVRPADETVARREPDPALNAIRIDIPALLQAMESALEEGGLHQALDLDKTLRLSNATLLKEHVQRLTVIRAELSRLLDWAKWSGNVSRQELVNVANGLMNNELAPTEIAKQVGGLRARWKELDRTSGGADKLLWGQFDAACSRAYAVADSYFKQQTQLRLANLQLARDMLAGIENEVNDFSDQNVDLKARQTYIGEIKKAWRKIGPIDRKFKASLEQEFEQKMTVLNQPLQVAQASAGELRRQLIQSVLAIAPGDRDAVTKVKFAQQRWQQETSGAWLARNVDQEMWRQFRAACDAVFAGRQAVADQQQLLRQQSAVARQACCERLEALSELSVTEIANAIRAARQEWHELSGQNRDMDTRFNTVIRKLEHRSQELIHSGQQKDLSDLRAKIGLCQRLEMASLSDHDQSDDQLAASCANWQRQWAELGILTSLKVAAHLNKLMHVRFQSALDLLSNRRMTDAKKSGEQLEQFKEQLLRIEIIRNLPSPEELMQQRLQLQVRQLQLAMKNRSPSENYLDNFYALCALPVPLSVQDDERLQRIINDSLSDAAV